ncbi:MAG: glycerate kinase type-2 family protein [Burkholderiales bacterium]
MNAQLFMRECFNAALAAADPLKIVPPHLPSPPKGRTLVAGAGKAGASMALAVENHWPKASPLEGLVITRYEHGIPTSRIKVIEAGHPVPDEQGEIASREILQKVQTLSPDDLLLALVSGGGSSLLSLPAEGISIAELKQLTKDLLRSGANIQEMNTVRKHLSAIAGGRLAAASRAPVCALIVCALIISDVTGDEPTYIASGPCSPDPSTYQDCLDILARHALRAPDAIGKHLERGARGEIKETPKPGDKIFERVENKVIATSHSALEAAAKHCESAGIRPVILGDSVSGEAREVAKVYGALVREIKTHSQPWAPPVALISGGETTVTVKGEGRGGRCSEFLLSLAIDLNGLDNVFALACDTDGIDGSEDNAGAWLAPDSLARAEKVGTRADKQLAANDAYGFFQALGNLTVTRPTRTNVNDFRVILVLSEL